ncbi:hypothetical protein T03_11868 [Trichinella britovi]|uniref:Uncharacterized protein n=1 Tax=Trichinella britovi TaxID=45882 RepID=A0A0V0ZBZ1_TRIBR|nr:hypothetical protein T03_11868 [Trichinella britovi]
MSEMFRVQKLANYLVVVTPWLSLKAAIVNNLPIVHFLFAYA